MNQNMKMLTIYTDFLLKECAPIKAAPAEATTWQLCLITNQKKGGDGPLGDIVLDRCVLCKIKHRGGCCFIPLLARQSHLTSISAPLLFSSFSLRGCFLLLLFISAFITPLLLYSWQFVSFF